MPPDDGTVIIARHPDVEKPPLQVWAFQFHINKSNGFLDDNWEWTPYTEEALKEVNKS